MKIIIKIDQCQGIDKNLVNQCQKGKWFNWNRRYLLRNLVNGKIAVISLNIFERWLWALQKFFCCSNYFAFKDVFAIRNVQVISPSSPCVSRLMICFISCHGVGPADHFAVYTEKLMQKGYDIEIYATGPSLKKFEERGIKVTHPFVLDGLNKEQEEELARKIAKTCSRASLVMTDVGHVFDIKIQMALSQIAPKVHRSAYYDNPEPFVPGGYSTVASEVMSFASSVFFANKNLAKGKIYSAPGIENDLTNQKRIGIGYYPLAQAKRIGERRKAEKKTVRANFLSKNGLSEAGQKIFVYFGGNNEEYFSKAFPAFLSMLSKTDALKDATVVIQQHPGAKAKNIDGIAVMQWKTVFGEQKRIPHLILSSFSSDEAQILGDVALYYQTSMGPQFLLEGLPTIQVGHKTYEDILVKNKLITSATKAKDLDQAIKDLDGKGKMPLQVLLDGLGIDRDNWSHNLVNGILQTIDINLKVQ